MVLAAGGSRRLGRPKQLLAYRGATLLDATLATARAAGLSTRSSWRWAGPLTEVRETVDLPAWTWCSTPTSATAARPRSGRPWRRVRDDADGHRAPARGPAGRDAPRRSRRSWPAPASTPWASARTTTGRATRCGSIGACSRRWPACTATRRSGSCVDADRDVVRVRGGGRRTPRRRHLGRLPGAARGRTDERTCPPPRRSAGASTSTATSPTRGWPPRCSSTLRLGLPLLLEGEPGVGKTAAAQVLAKALDAPLVRLQCYEGLTAERGALRLEPPASAARDPDRRVPARADREADLFSEEFLRGAADPALHPVRRAARPGAADRRGRPGRRRVRGAAPRGARRGLGHRPRARHLHGRAAADRGAHLQPQPGPARRAAPALPLPLAGVPRPGPGRGDPAPQRARRPTWR